MKSSKFVNAFSAAGKFSLESFQNSKTRSILLGINRFIEASFYNSFFAKIFNFKFRLRFSTLKTRLDKDIFSPYFIFPLVFFGFVAFSTYKISNLALASIAIGILFFMLGVSLSSKFKFGDVRFENSAKDIGIFLSSLGIFALIYDIFYAGSIPLFSSIARRNLSVLYTYLASFAVPGVLILISIIGKNVSEGKIELEEARGYSIVAALLFTALVSLLGYRTQTLVALLGCTIVMHHWRLISIGEIFFAFFTAAAAVAGLGYYRALKEGSSVNFFEIIGKRAGLTLSIYDHLVSRFWVFGVNHGYTLLATFSSFMHFIPGPKLGPRTIVANIFGIQEISITSTLFGTVVLDFGIPGIVVFSLLLGFVVGLAHNAMKQTKSALAAGIFGLLMAYTLVGIETGLVDFNVAVFFISSFLILS